MSAMNNNSLISDKVWGPNEVRILEIVFPTVGLLFITIGEVQLPPHLYSYNLLLTFSPALYIGFITLNTGFVYSLLKASGDRVCLIANTGVLFYGLYFLPFLLGGPPGGHVYDFLSQSIQILNSGKLNLQVFPFEYYPGSWIFYSSFVAISGLKAIGPIIGTFDLGWQLLFGLAVFTIVRLIVGSWKMGITGLWVFFIADWLDQAYISDQSAGYMMFLVTVLIVLLLLKNNTPSIRTLSIGCIAIMCLILLHILASLLMVLILIVLSVREKRLRKLALFSIFAIGAWNSQFSWPRVAYIFESVGGLLSAYLETIESGLIEKTQVVTNSLGHVLSVNLELIDVAVFYTITLLEIIFVLRRKAKYNDFQRSSFRLLLTIIFVSFIILGSFLAQGGPELYQRIFLFSLLPISTFSSMIMFTRNKILLTFLLCFLMFSCPINILAQYNTQPGNFVSRAQLYATSYLALRPEYTNIYGSLSLGIYLFTPSNRTFSLSSLNFDSGNVIASLATNSYVGLSSLDLGNLVYNSGANMSYLEHYVTALDASTSLSVVYMNPSATIYFHPG
jgi:hypothetical protein